MHHATTPPGADHPIGSLRAGELQEAELRAAFGSIKRNADLLSGNFHLIGGASYPQWRSGDAAALRHLDLYVLEAKQIASALDAITINVVSMYVAALGNDKMRDWLYTWLESAQNQSGKPAIVAF